MMKCFAVKLKRRERAQDSNLANFTINSKLPSYAVNGASAKPKESSCMPLASGVCFSPFKGKDAEMQISYQEPSGQSGPSYACILEYRIVYCTEDIGLTQKWQCAVSTVDDGRGLGLSSTPTPGRHSEIIVFTLSDLVQATNNFSPSLKIGQGGFGAVYKGKLKDGKLVAIKRAKKGQHDRQLSSEFHNELVALSNIEHLNLVKFVGYVEEGSERLLVVEYVANGNLRQHLDGQYGATLDWATRVDIAIDVAHAVTYLHLYADQSVIHRDIKASNILLTENFRAKVADFGFSRFGPSDADATHVTTQVKGTAGYLDPEYLKSYQLTQKSDVYSFGVLLVELFTGRRPIEPKREPDERITTRWAFEMFLAGKADDTLDPKLERSSSALLMLERLLELAFKCAAPTRLERPSMKRASEILCGIRRDYTTFWEDRTGQVIRKSNSPRP